MCVNLWSDENKMRTVIHVLFDIVANKCACPNGVGMTGSGCDKDGDYKCASCNPGFTLNDARTQCIGTWP